MEWSQVTHDESRLRLWESLRGGVDCVLQRGPSYAWLSQAVGASKRARRRLSQLSVRLRRALWHLIARLPCSFEIGDDVGQLTDYKSDYTHDTYQVADSINQYCDFRGYSIYVGLKHVHCCTRYHTLSKGKITNA